MAPAFLGRRAVLAGGAAIALSLAARAFAAPAGKLVISLDWGISETLYAMGIPVAGAASVTGYDSIVADPPTPAGTRDVGLWAAPNIELVHQLAPDLVLRQSWQAGLLPLLQPISPVETTTIYTRDGSPYARACAATRVLANRAGRPDAGETLVAAGETAFAGCRDALRGYDGRPVVVMKVYDGRNFIIFSRCGLFHDVLETLELTNGWAGPPTLLCGATSVDLAGLAGYGEANVVVIGTPGQKANQKLYDSDLWASLPFVKERRIRHVPSFWEFGALPTAHRFARHLTAALAGIRPS